MQVGGDASPWVERLVDWSFNHPKFISATLNTAQSVSSSRSVGMYFTRVRFLKVSLPSQLFDVPRMNSFLRFFEVVEYFVKFSSENVDLFLANRIQLNNLCAWLDQSASVVLFEEAEWRASC